MIGRTTPHDILDELSSPQRRALEDARLGLLARRGDGAWQRLARPTLGRLHMRADIEALARRGLVEIILADAFAQITPKGRPWAELSARRFAKFQKAYGALRDDRRAERQTQGHERVS